MRQKLPNFLQHCFHKIFFIYILNLSNLLKVSEGVLYLRLSKSHESKYFTEFLFSFKINYRCRLYNFVLTTAPSIADTMSTKEKSSEEADEDGDNSIIQRPVTLRRKVGHAPCSIQVGGACEGGVAENVSPSASITPARSVHDMDSYFYNHFCLNFCANCQIMNFTLDPMSN